MACRFVVWGCGLLGCGWLLLFVVDLLVVGVLVGNDGC